MSMTVSEVIRTKRAVRQFTDEPLSEEAILGVPQDFHFDVTISFGYPLPSREQSHTPKPNGRKPFEEVVFWERWGV